jgi:hypothetical protein
LGEIDNLFKLPLTEFTAARNALAASMKEAGRAEDAAAVKALTKPSISAWAVNQLYWQHRKAFDQLLAAGEKLRKAQTSQLAGKGGELRAPMEALRSALTDLVKRAAALFAASSRPPAPDLTRRITTTLEALATYGTQPGAPPAGRLTADVDPPGFEALSALVPRGKGKRAASSEPSRVLQFRPPAKAPAKKLSAAARKRQEAQERKAERKAAIAALREAERTLRDARKAVAQSQAALRKAAARAKVTEKAKAALEKRFENVSADADAARQEARRVASAAEEAAQSVQDAERAVEKAQQAVNP